MKSENIYTRPETNIYYITASKTILSVSNPSGEGPVPGDGGED